MSAHPDDLASVTAANRDRLMGVAAAISTITNSERHMIDLSNLEAKARAATKGEWECRHGDEVWLAIEGDIGRHVATADREEDAAYIAAAQPSVVLQLIERVKTLEEALGALHGDSLDAIMEVIGEGEKFASYNLGKSKMRDWFLRRISALIARPEVTK